MNTTTQSVVNPAAIIVPASMIPAAAIVPAAVISVDGLLREACTLADSMTAKTKEAARLAAKELNSGVLSVAERVAAVVTAHAAGYAGNHNVKAIFSDALWLLAVPAARVESQIKGEDKPKVFTAEQSIDLPKHAMRDAAKQVREQEGAGRATGGGRKAATAATATATPVPNAAVAAASATNTWFDTLQVKIADAGELAKIVAALERAGYTVAKKGKTVRAAAPATNADVPSMATQLKDKILAAAQA